ncbi:MAG TPA: Pycsar system effector family protein [Chryseolinea sp.]|nr:Pycsar system effector family protein [Chryseolinea sp.]
MESELIREARALAEKQFSSNAFDKCYFHNLDHTIEVANAASEIGIKSDLLPEELDAVIAAAWLHDLGYQEGAQNHEDNSIRMAADLVRRLGTPFGKVNLINNAILATRMPQQPKSMVDKVLCDADLYHLSEPDYEAKGDLLRKEWVATKQKELTDEEWLTKNLEFMESHRYQTPYGQTVLEEGKRKNLKRLRKRLDPDVSKKKYKKLQEEVLKLRSKLEKVSTLKPDRGIETMFKTTSHNHVMLSQMVDSKASILITINSIILSVVVSVLIRKLEENPYLTYPTILLVSVCLATMVFSILASRPNISSGKFTREDIKNKRTNLLFFGNFHGMNVDDYQWGMKEMMKDADYLYGSLIKDIYYLGRVLGTKYRYLRIAYSIFMYGFVIAVLSFIVAFQLSAKGNL